MSGDHRPRAFTRFTRRRVLTVAATVGVGASAVSVAGLSAARESRPAADGPIVVHLRDARSGTFDVFHGSRRVEVRDRDLADRLLEAASRR
jgi:hypothetical protein